MKPTEHAISWDNCTTDGEVDRRDNLGNERPWRMVAGEASGGSTGRRGVPGHDGLNHCGGHCPVEQRRRRQELEDFVRQFKAVRTQLGFTQSDVGLSLGTMYGSVFSQTMICRFEAQQLSVKNMTKLRSLLDTWLNEMTHDDCSSSSSSCATGSHLEAMLTVASLQRSRRFKRRTSIMESVRHELEEHFRKEPRPLAMDINRLAGSVGLEKDVVRVWFCNRRQREKKEKKEIRKEKKEIQKEKKVSAQGRKGETEMKKRSASTCEDGHLANETIDEFAQRQHYVQRRRADDEGDVVYTAVISNQTNQFCLHENREISH